MGIATSLGTPPCARTSRTKLTQNPEKGRFKSLQMLIIVAPRQLFSGTVRGAGEHGTR